MKFSIQPMSGGFEFSKAKKAPLKSIKEKLQEYNHRYEKPPTIVILDNE